MSHTPGPWIWRRPFPGDPEIWVEAVDQKGDDIIIAVLEGGNETDAKIICTASKMYERLCEALYYVDCAACYEPEAECLAKAIRELLSER